MITLVFDFLRQHLRSLGRAVLVLAGPPIALLAVVSGLMITDMLDMSRYDADTLGPAIDLLERSLVTLLLAYVVAAILLAVINSYVLIYLERKGEGEIEVADVRERLFENIGMVIGTLLATTIITMVGFLLLFIPGIYLAVALSIVLTVRMVEGKGMFEAIKRSTSLMTGYWWMTLGLILVISIIDSMIGMVFAIPQYVVSGIYAMVMVDGETPGSALNLLLVITTIFQTFGSNLLNAILILAVTFNYFNLVERKEGVGSMARIEEIGASADAESF